MKTLHATIFLVLMLGTLSAAIDVLETETPLFSVHLPIDPEKMQNMLGDRLEPDIYDGKAYIQVSVFHITRLQFKLPWGSWKSFGMESWCLRISAFVKVRETEEKGYVILSADFEGNPSGRIMTGGCKQSQIGTQCGTVKVKHTLGPKAGETRVIVEQSGKPLLQLGAIIQDGPITNESFFRWATERYARFRLSTDKQTLLRGEQDKDAKTFTDNRPFSTQGSVSFYSAIFNKKFAQYGWYELDNVADPCAQGQCFFTADARFKDREAKEF